MSISMHQLNAESRYDSIVQYQLRSYLFSGYDADARPVTDLNRPTFVSAYLNLNQIIEIVNFKLIKI